MNASLNLLRLGAIVAAVSFITACGQAPSGQRSPVEAGFVTVAAEPVAVTSELPGRLEAYKIAEIRARVAGVIQKRIFVEGSDVKEGKVLFLIDPRSYQASRDNAAAALARAQANQAQADIKLKRYGPLVEIDAVSKQDYDDATAAQKQAAADVAAARANLTNAKLNLEYAHVAAPISGRIGRSLVTEGALVGQTDATLLATIQQIDPIYLNLTQASAEIMRIRRAIQSGQLASASQNSMKVTLVLEDGTVYSHPGKLLFSDITVDPTTGEIAVRAIFPNKERMLLPGMFVRARIEQAVNENAILVPQQAVQRTTEGANVMIIGEDNKVQVRVVKTGASVGTKWVVNEGLQPGDRVIVEGLQKVRPGAPVTPVPWQESKPGSDKNSQAAVQKNESDKAPAANQAAGNNTKTDSPAPTASQQASTPQKQ